MANLKRNKESEWGFGEILGDLPDGVESESIQLDADTILLQITCPADFSTDQMDGVVRWGKRLREKLPENTFLLVTTEEIKIKIIRPPIPKQLRITMHDTIISTPRMVLDMLKEEVKHFEEGDLSSIELDIHGCKIDFTDDKDQKLQHKYMCDRDGCQCPFPLETHYHNDGNKHYCSEACADSVIEQPVVSPFVPPPPVLKSVAECTKCEGTGIGAPEGLEGRGLEGNCSACNGSGWQQTPLGEDDE